MYLVPLEKAAVWQMVPQKIMLVHTLQSALICTSTNCKLCRTGSLSADFLQAELLASIKKVQTQTPNLLTGLYAISPPLVLFLFFWGGERGGWGKKALNGSANLLIS